MVTFSAVVVAVLSVAGSALAETCPTIAPVNAATFAPGYSGRVVVNGLRGPRSILFDNQGNLLTTERSAYGVRYIQLFDNNGTDVCVRSQKQLISDASINHGIALAPCGTKLYVSSATTVWSWDYDGTSGTVSNRKTVVTGMSNSGHATRTLLIPRANPDVLLVQVGSDGNLDLPSEEPKSGRAQVRIFQRAEIENEAQAYTAGEILAYRIRNNVAIAEDPRGGIFSVNNGMDSMEVNGLDVHHTNPCEKLNYHGVISDSACSSAERGAQYGYPTCHAIWDPSVLPPPFNDEAGGVGVGTPLLNGDNSFVCERQAPKLCFPAHTAPLDMKFNADGTAAYIAFHGSWNRSPPDGYRVSRVEFDPDTGMPVEPVTSTTAALDIMYNADHGVCPRGCFRPVGLAWSPSGKSFVTGDATNEIWVIGGAT